MKHLYVKITLLGIFLFCTPPSKANEKHFVGGKGKIHLNIYLDQATAKDTLIISVNSMLGTMFPGLESLGTKENINDKGYFEFDIPVGKPYGYFQLFKIRNLNVKQSSQSFTPIFSPQFWEVGDSLTLNIKFRENPSGLGSLEACTFQGTGALKYIVAMKLNFRNFKLSPETDVQITGIPPENWDGNILNYDNFDAIITKKMVMLDSLKRYKANISDLSYNIIKSYILYPSVSFGIIETFLRSGGLNKLDENSKAQFIKRLNYSFDYPTFHGITKDGLDNSIDIMALLMNRFKVLSYLNNGEYSLDWIYSAVKNDPNISRTIKETLIMRFISMPFRDSHNLSTIYNDARIYITNPEYAYLLKKVSARLPGRKFYPFNLPDTKGSMRSLSDFKDKVVIIDFWFSGCLSCSHFFKNTLSKVEQSFKSEKDAVFISISIDKDKSMWINSVNKEMYTSKHIVNLYTNGLGYQHEMLQEMNITGFPCAILIDRNGVIKEFNSPNLYNEISLKKTIQDLLQTY